jgi:hypothetical protein
MPVALMPSLQNKCVAALKSRPRADSSSPAAGIAVEFFFDVDLPMRASKSNRSDFSKSHLHPLKKIASEAATALRLSKPRLANSRAILVKRLQSFSF